jgi:hypothetical protein
MHRMRVHKITSTPSARTSTKALWPSLGSVRIDLEERTDEK